MAQTDTDSQKTNPDASRVSGIAAAAIGGAIESDEHPPQVASPAASAQPTRNADAEPGRRTGDTGETVHMAEVRLNDVEDDTDQSWRRAGGGENANRSKESDPAPTAGDDNATARSGGPT